MPISYPPAPFASQGQIRVADARVAYVDEGVGPPVLLLHGCPFSSFIWRKIVPRLAGRFRCLAPDLLGLGDTETPSGTDWSLPAQVDMILGFLDALEIERAHVVGHDHGGAIAQLLAADHSDRIDRLVLSNAEAYDNWPSGDERSFLRAAAFPLVGPVVVWLWARRPLLRLALAAGGAVCDRRALDHELLTGLIRANFADRHRRAKTRRFLTAQLDPRNQRVTLDLLEGLRRFERPTLLVWGAEDPHFGPGWGEQLAHDIPGVVGLELVRGAGHLLMEEQPERVGALIERFLGASTFGEAPAATRAGEGTSGWRPS